MTNSSEEPSKKVSQPVELNDEGRAKLSRMAADLPGLMEYAHTVGGFAIIPDKEGAIRSKAMQAMTEQTQMALDQIKEQMLLLAKQAQELKRRVEISAEIYAAKMSFHPQVGYRYFLYTRKKDLSKMLSMIGPQEWGVRGQDLEFVSAVELLADHTWRVV